MLTLQVMPYLKGTECGLASPFGTMPQEPLHPKRTRRNAKPVPWSYQLRGSAQLCKLDSQNSGELRPPIEIFLSLQTNYYELKYISITDLCSDLWLDKKIYFCSLGNKKNTRETINVSTIAVIHYFYYWESFWSICDWFQIYYHDRIARY